MPTHAVMSNGRTRTIEQRHERDATCPRLRARLTQTQTNLPSTGTRPPGNGISGAEQQTAKMPELLQTETETDANISAKSLKS